MKISVVLTTYNGEKYIEDQLDSIRLQTVRPDRVLICDDCSSDSTVDIVINYIRKYNLCNNWNVLINEKNLGYIENFYKGISLCNEELIFLSDQDDIWHLEKIEKMAQVINSNQSINLLSCKYRILNNRGKILKHSIEYVEKNDLSLRQVTIDEIMKAYRWPGMFMCIKKSFFNRIINEIKDKKIPHDLAFAILAAEENSFYQFNFIGAYHRRHNNNLAREEHRIHKLLNLERKLKDINIMEETLDNVIKANLSLSITTKDLIGYKLNYFTKRKKYLKEKNIKKIYELYKNDKYNLFRVNSVLCDIWLCIFG